MFGWSKAIKEAVTTKDVMEHLVAVMTRALEREWELRIENSELRKQLAVGCGPLTEDSGGAPSDNSGWKVVTGLWTGEGGAASTTEGTELHGKVGGHTAVEWKETAEALQLVANRLEKEKAELAEELADLRPMPDRLEVANVVREVYRLIPSPTWEAIGPIERAQSEAMLKLFAGRTDADYEKLERVNEQLQEGVAELRRDKEPVQRAYARLTAERDALAAELEALKSNTPELTDDEVERLCEVYCQYRYASPSGFVRYVDQSPSDKVAIRAGIRAVARELPRLPCPSPEVKQLTEARDLAHEQVRALMQSVKVAGDARDAMEKQLDALRSLVTVGEDGDLYSGVKALQEEKALQGENISAFQMEQEVLKSEKVALMERVEGLQAELEDLTSRKVSGQEGVLTSGEVSDLLDALGVEQGMTLRAAVHYRMGDWKRQQERLARYMGRVESLKSELEMTRTQLDESQAANAAIPAVHQQVVSDLKAEHALNQDAMRQNHENELAGIRQMLEQERGLVQAAACGPWMSMDVIAPTEGMVALLEMKEGLGEDTEPVTPWRLEFGFYDASRSCWWTSIGQQDRKLVQRMAVVRKGNLRAEIQEMLQVGNGEGGIKNSEGGIKNSELRSEKEEGAEGLGEGVGNGEVRRENGEGAPVTEVPGVGKAAV